MVLEPFQLSLFVFGSGSDSSSLYTKLFFLPSDRHPENNFTETKLNRDLKEIHFKSKTTCYKRSIDIPELFAHGHSYLSRLR